MNTKLHYFRWDWIEQTDTLIAADACVYGGTAAGVIAAATLAARGVSVVLVHPGHTLGGMTTGGLGLTDYGCKEAIGGRSLDFYCRLGALHDREQLWHFTPGDAQRVMDSIAESSGVRIIRCAYLDRVELHGGRIAKAHFVGGLRLRASVWLDCSYEGDLMAAADVSFAIGREGNDKYGEQANGVQVREKHQFDPAAVDPFIIPGDSSSGLLGGIESRNLYEHIGRSDHRVQAYCFRVCMTDDPALKMPWQKPAGYNALDHELAVRWFNQDDKGQYNEQLPGGAEKPQKFDILDIPTPGGFSKTDTNNHGPVSSDFIGAGYQWATADHALREKIFQQHLCYQQGFYWTMANDPRIPQRYRDAYSRWGLPRDEYLDTDGWPHQLYVREARRLIGDVVLTEHVCHNRLKISDPIGMGSYTLDSHNCTRFVGADGFVHNEGDVQLGVSEPYPISYRCIVPRVGQCQNLLVPVCFSASHIAYGSARMEPVFMVLAESAAIAAALSLDANVAVQDVDYNKLRTQIEDSGQTLSM